MNKVEQFKVYAPLNKSFDNANETYLNPDGSLTITGVASTSNKDLYGDVIKPSAIESMKKQAESRNLHGDYDYGLFNGSNYFLIKDSKKYMDGIKDAVKLMEYRQLKFKLSEIEKGEYKTILTKLGKYRCYNFKKSEIEKRLTHEEQEIFPEFIEKMIKIKIIHQVSESNYFLIKDSKKY